jgi:hypothetical protein
MDEEDAMIYRIEVVAEKDRQGMPAEETVRT